MRKPGRLIHLEQFRKATISAFILFHFCALMLWILPPYSEMIAKAPHTGSPVRQFEPHLFAALTAPDDGPVSNLVGNYIDILGAYQYWDFFAPETPRIHRYLSVCTDIFDAFEPGRIECINPLYQSYEGDVDHAAQAHHGNRSRSFRLVENQFRLKRPDLLNAFTRYWLHKKYPDQPRTAFLLLHEFTLQPGSRDTKSESRRRDELIWIALE
ncbi:MAG: hypothetical protein L0Y39_12135 [Methylococcaceae bacterium]|nr:hypothetical protein [Methylococcaceae bacterium]